MNQPIWKKYLRHPSNWESFPHTFEIKRSLKPPPTVTTVAVQSVQFTGSCLVPRFLKQVPSLKLTWHLKMDGWKTIFLLGWPIFRCYVSFMECKPNELRVMASPRKSVLDPQQYVAPRRHAKSGPSMGGGDRGGWGSLLDLLVSCYNLFVVTL